MRIMCIVYTYTIIYIIIHLWHIQSRTLGLTFRPSFVAGSIVPEDVRAVFDGAITFRIRAKRIVSTIMVDVVAAEQ